MKITLIIAAGMAALLADIGAIATFRALLPSVSDACGQENLGEGFDYNLRRRLQISQSVGM